MSAHPQSADKHSDAEAIAASLASFVTGAECPNHESAVQHTDRPVPARSRSAPTSVWLIRSTEISTAVTVPLFSSQCLVFLSSGQPTPGP